MMKRLKWKNIAICMAMLMSGYVVLHDVYILIATTASLTIFGFVTFMVCLSIMVHSYEKINEKIN